MLYKIPLSGPQAALAACYAAGIGFDVGPEPALYVSDGGRESAPGTFLGLPPRESKLDEFRAAMRRVEEDPAEPGDDVLARNILRRVEAVVEHRRGVALVR